MKKMLILAAAGLAASAANAQVLYSNGGLAELRTGTMTRAGSTLTLPGEWSEIGDDGTTAHSSAGNNVLQGSFRIADDFTVPSGQTWNITGVELFLYQTGATGATVTAATIAIHSQDPVSGAPPAFGSQTTSIPATAVATDVYRIFNTFANGACGATAPSGTNRIMQVVTVPVNFTLSAGTYWLDWGATGSAAFSGPWCPQLSPKPLGSGLFEPSYNARQGGAGSPAAFNPSALTVRTPNPCTVNVQSTEPMAYPFTILGNSGGGCDPDITTGAVPGQPGYGVPNGILNNDDFFYFLAQFAAGNLAVADVTTGAVPGQPGYGVPNGVINNDDFFYYLAIFAAGCP